MSGEKCFSLAAAMFVNVFHNGPGDGNAVVGTCAASKFVEQHQTSVRKVIQNTCSFVHFHHKCTFALRNIVAGTHAGKNLIDYPDFGTFHRHKTSNLSHERYQCSLSEQSRLTRHVGTCNNDDLLRFPVEKYIVCHIAFADRQLLLYHRMASLFDFYHIAVVDFGADVFIFRRNFRE